MAISDEIVFWEVNSTDILHGSTAKPFLAETSNIFSGDKYHRLR